MKYIILFLYCMLLSPLASAQIGDDGCPPGAWCHPIGPDGNGQGLGVNSTGGATDTADAIGDSLWQIQAAGCGNAADPRAAIGCWLSEWMDCHGYPAGSPLNNCGKNPYPPAGSTPTPPDDEAPTPPDDETPTPPDDGDEDGDEEMASSQKVTYSTFIKTRYEFDKKSKAQIVKGRKLKIQFIDGLSKVKRGEIISASKSGYTVLVGKFNLKKDNNPLLGGKPRNFSAVIESFSLNGKSLGLTYIEGKGKKVSFSKLTNKVNSRP